MKFTLGGAHAFGWDGISGQAYNNKEQFDRMSAALITVDGRHGRVLDRTGDRLYLVLRGQGKFDLDGTAVAVAAQDIVIIPRNTPYDYEGQMEVFLVQAPSFDPSTEERLS
jgi:mannose-6-phosphate isomerase-like protein (cupin superfamily)